MSSWKFTIIDAAITCLNSEAGSREKKLVVEYAKVKVFCSTLIAQTPAVEAPNVPGAYLE